MIRLSAFLSLDGKLFKGQTALACMKTKWCEHCSLASGEILNSVEASERRSVKALQIARSDSSTLKRCDGQPGAVAQLVER